MDCKLYIGNLNTDATKEEVEESFSKFGEIEHVWIARKPAGFAFVIFKSTEAASDAIRDMNGYEIRGQAIKVEMANSDGKKKRRDDRGGRGGYSDSRMDTRRDEYRRDERRDEPKRDYRRDEYRTAEPRRDDRRDRYDYERPSHQRDYDYRPAAPYGGAHRSRSRSHDDRRYYSDRR